MADPERPLTEVNASSLPFAEMDSSNELEDYQTFFAKMRSNSNRTLSLIAAQRPELAISFVKMKVEEVLSRRAECPPQDASNPETGYCTVNSDTYIYWDGALYIMKAVMDAVPEVQDPGHVRSTSLHHTHPLIDSPMV